MGDPVLAASPTSPKRHRGRQQQAGVRTARGLTQRRRDRVEVAAPGGERQGQHHQQQGRLGERGETGGSARADAAQRGTGIQCGQCECRAGEGE